MAQAQIKNRDMDGLSIPLERDAFMRNLIRELSGLLEDMVGLEEAAGFISVVGQHMGARLNNDYRQALKVSNLNRGQIAQVLVDLKQRIKGDFYIIEEDDTRIVLGNRVCPFADKVKDRPSLCMMTSNIFGVIAAENHGYGKVSLEQTIAQGDAECRVVVYLESSDEAQAAEGREYYKTEG